MPAKLRAKKFIQERQLQNFDIVSPDGNIVGRAQLRLVPSKSIEMPEGFESHVYYEVDEPEQGKGYATDALKELLRLAKQHDINPLVATVNTSNIASIKVINNCGGKLVDKGTTTSGVKVLKYSLEAI
jgi:predicted acetyltransferase